MAQPNSPSASPVPAEVILPETEVLRTGEYSRNGEFHRNLNPNWSYYPIYLNKVALVDELLQKYGSPEVKTLDAGCGEGVLVEKYASQGWNITGIDKNYASTYVQQGSITEMPFPKNTFGQVLCLDVLEHLDYRPQEKALNEIKRVLQPGGLVIISIPNLSHFTSRLKFIFRGRLLRTASRSHHPGDRPAMEYAQLLRDKGFEIIDTQGIFPTVPPFYRMVMHYPAKSVGLVRFLRKIPFPVYWNFQVLFVCRVAKDTDSQK